MLHMKKAWLVLLVVVALSMAATPVLAASSVANDPAAIPTHVAGPREFARCVVADIKLIPQAKKLTPSGYQQLENSITDASRALSAAQIKNPYLAAVKLGITIGKFLAFDLVWGIGIMQDCLPKLLK